MVVQVAMVEEITVGSHSWDSPLKEASKVEAIMKALMRVERKFQQPYNWISTRARPASQREKNRVGALVLHS